MSAQVHPDSASQAVDTSSSSLSLSQHQQHQQHQQSALPSSFSSITTTTTTAAASTSSAPDGSGRQPAASATVSTELAREPLDAGATRQRVLSALRQFPDFPIPGIDFIDILPIFQDPRTFDALLQVLEQRIRAALGSAALPDVLVGLDARGFLFGPSLALRLNRAFVPVRKKGKMPGPCVTAAYEKEYGADYFQMQADAIKPGQSVLIVDDIIATGGSAAAAGSLVNQLGGKLVGYLFMIEISALKGRDKLGDLPIITLLDHS